METVDELKSTISKLQESVDDVNNLTKTQYFHFLDGVLDNIGAQGERLDNFGNSLKSLEAKVAGLGSGTGSETYSGPHPLSSVTIPSAEQVKKIEALAKRSSMQARPDEKNKQPTKPLAEMKPVTPPLPPGVDEPGDVKLPHPKNPSNKGN